MFLAIGMYPCGTYIADTALFVYLEQEYIQADSGHRRTKGQQLNWLETAVQGRSMRRLEGVLGKKAWSCWNTAGKSTKIRQEGRFEVIVIVTNSSDS